jgi:hypothetical protein
VQSFLDFPTLSSIASKPSVSWCSRSCIPRVIRDSGRTLEGARANRRIEADLRKRALPACSAAHAQRLGRMIAALAFGRQHVENVHDRFHEGRL